MGQCSGKSNKAKKKYQPTDNNIVEGQNDGAADRNTNSTGKEKPKPIDNVNDQDKPGIGPNNGNTCKNNPDITDTGKNAGDTSDKHPQVDSKDDKSRNPEAQVNPEHTPSVPPSSTGSKGQTKSSTTSGYSSSSGWTDSSDSSDSSYGPTKVKQTGKKTVYSKSKSKTIVKGSYNVIDNRNGVLNIKQIGHQTVVEKLFVGTGYSLEEALEVEQTQHIEVPYGGFVNLREKHLAQESAFSVQVRAEASAWVGMIVLGDISGTCFRVGANKIMTALHVIKLILDRVYFSKKRGSASSIFVKHGVQEAVGNTNEEPHAAALSRLEDVFVDFSYIKGYAPKCVEHNIFKLKPLMSIIDVPFFDNDTDCIILEILPNAVGAAMPPQFNFFSYPKLEEGFHIIGHPGGLKKTFDHVEGFFDPRKEKTKNDIDLLKKESQEFLARHKITVSEFCFDVEQYIYSTERFLFNCTALHGASGAPGIVVDEEGKVIVVTMLLHGYPDWYYDPKSTSFRDDWPKQYRIEQGADMLSICAKIELENPTLCNEIFDRD